MNSLIRKAVTGLLLAVSLCLPIVPALSADTHTAPLRATVVHRSYRLYYRYDCRSPWMHYYTFSQPLEAARYANWLQHHYGYETLVRR